MNEDKELLNLGYLPPDKWNEIKSKMLISIPKIKNIFFSDKDNKKHYLIDTYFALSGRIIHPHFYRGDLLYFTGEVTKNATYDPQTKYVKINANFSATGNAEGYILDSLNLKTEDTIIFAEGFWDGIKLQLLDIPVVTFGTCKISKYFIDNYYYKLKSFKKVVVCFDTDKIDNQSGLKGAIALCTSLLEKGITQLYISELPSRDGEKMDIDDYLSAIPNINDKKNAVKGQIIQEGINFYNYLVNELNLIEENELKLKKAKELFKIAHRYDELTEVSIQRKIKDILELREVDFSKVFKTELKTKKIENTEEKMAEIKENIELKNEILTQLALKKRTEASELMVIEILSKQKIYTTRNDINEEVWLYIDGIYKSQGKTYIKEFCRNILGETYTIQLNNEVLNKIEADTYIESDDFFNINNVFELPVQNGILNLKTRKLTEFTPEKIFFNKLPMKYDTEAKCPAISKHFKEVLSSEEDIRVMEEIFGSILLKDYRIEKAIMTLGDGRNGKGKTLTLMKQFVGLENYSAVALRNMREDNFRLIDMFKSLVNLSGDLSDTSLKEIGCLKQLIGRDPISADRKHLNGLIFVNYATLIFAANNLPIVYDNTAGFWDKWVLLIFPYKFITQKEYDNLSEKDKINKKIIDPDHIKKISNIGELSGLLNLALDGFDRLMKNNNYSYSTTGNDLKKYWIRHSDSFGAFCIDCLESDYNGFIPTKELMKKYGEYRKYLKLKNTGTKEIGARLEADFGSTNERQTVFSDTIGNNQERGWTGFKFKLNLTDFMNNLREKSGKNYHKIKPQPDKNEQLKMVEKLIDDFTKNDKNTFENIKSHWVEFGKIHKLYDFDEFIRTLITEGFVYEPKPGFLRLG